MLLLAASLIIGFAAVAAALGSLDEIVGWLKRGLIAVQKAINMIVLGTKVFVKKIGEAFKEIQKNYSQDVNGKWHETIVSREISEDLVPLEFRNKVKAMDKEEDMTGVLQLHLN